MPCSMKVARTASSAMVRRVAAPIRSTIGGGVRAGANRPVKLTAIMPGSPDSTATGSAGLTLEDERCKRQDRDRRKILDRIIGRLRHGDRVEHVGSGTAKQQRVAVGLRTRDRGGPDRAAGAALVLDIGIRVRADGNATALEFQANYATCRGSSRQVCALIADADGANR
jgi:hypothetical protein